MEVLPIELPASRIADLCRRWQIRKLSVFGSALREDFRPESDIDLLITFDARAPWSFWELVDLRQDLEAVLGRNVDIVEERSLVNPFRRRSILRSARVIYDGK